MSISLQNIRLAYGSRTLLENVSADIPAATLTAFLGRNGTGKSSLLRAIAGLNKVSEGEIRLCVRPLAALEAKQLAATVSFVATDKLRIANLTCEQMVALGRAPYTDWLGRMRETDRAAVRRALETVGLTDYAAKTMDTLSDGECQRAMIARALAQDTPVILLDEPTAFLDLPNRYAMVSLLARLARDEGKCVLFSTHDLEIALSHCDAVLLIDTPQLRHIPASEVASSGAIERLFAGSGVTYDPAAKRLRPAER